MDDPFDLPKPKAPPLALPPPGFEGERIDARAMSPRQFADWVHEQYVAGILGWEDYGAAIPTELHPGYDRTIGALTGQASEPDRPRDMVAEWEEKLAFLRRHNGWGAVSVRQAERILTLLRRSLQQG